MRACPRCTEPNPERATYCMFCGASIATIGSEPSETRRMVTVLFTDVVRSVAIGERLDAERLRQVMSRYFDYMRSEVERHGGTVEKFIGDAIMAVFGNPILHDDDALRAARAAVDMRNALHKLNLSFKEESDIEIAMRTGINTGEVVFGHTVAEQNLVVGDAVNVAARLEQVAEPGEILIGETTYRLIRDVVEVEQLDPLRLKGKSHPVGAYRLIDAPDLFHENTHRFNSAVVGRERELGLLVDIQSRASHGHSCHLCTIIGYAGVGKSRLIDEFLVHLGPSTRLLSGRCLPYGEGITFWPIVQIVQRASGIAVDDGPEEIGRKLDKCTAQVGDAHVASALRQLFGLSDRSVAVEELFWSVARLLEWLATEQSVVAVFEDIHWAEPTLLDLVEYLADQLRGVPLLILCTARHELLDNRPAWAGGKLNSTMILLEPLSEADSDRLIDNLTWGAELPIEVRSRIRETTGGNPLFVEEMLSMMVDEGFLIEVGNGWDVRGDVGRLSIPPTIQALLGARLDQLGREERAVLGAASVIGKDFDSQALEEIVPEVKSDLQEHLLTLVRKDLIRPDKSADGSSAFSFRHILVQDVAYRAMSKEVRAQLHESFASWLERDESDRIPEYEEILAFHLERVYHYRMELGGSSNVVDKAAARASHHLAVAGRRALARGDVRASTNLLSRAATARRVADRTRTEVLLDLLSALQLAGDLERARHIADELTESASSSGEEALVVRAQVANNELRLGIDPSVDTERIKADTSKAIGILEREGDKQGLAPAWHLVAQIYWLQGQVESARKSFQRSLEAAQNMGDTARESDARRWIVWTLPFGSMSIDEALRRCDEIALDSLDDQRTQAYCKLAKGTLLGKLGRFKEARLLHERGRTAVADLGMQRVYAAAAFNKKIIELAAGNLSVAEEELRNSYGVLERMGETQFLSSVAGDLADVLTRAGKFDEADHYSHVAEDLSASGDKDAEIWWRVSRARVHVHRGDLDTATAVAEEALSIARTTDMLDTLAEAYEVNADILFAKGEEDKARDMLREAQSAYSTRGAIVDEKRVRERLT